MTEKRELLHCCARCGSSWRMHQGANAHQGHPVVCDQFQTHPVIRDLPPDPARVRALEDFYDHLEVANEADAQESPMVAKIFRAAGQKCLDLAPAWPLG